MMPHHLRLLLVILAFPLLYFMGFGLYQLYSSQIQDPLHVDVNTARIHYPNYHRVAEKALKSFAALPEGERQRTVDTLNMVIQDFDDWALALSRQRQQLICLGEDHANETRRFLAEKLFPILNPDVLMLEATGSELSRIQDDTGAYIALLDADISKVLRAQTSETKIVGIEQTAAQKRLPREQAIFENLLRSAAPDRLNVVLYGALHCADTEAWLYRIVKGAKQPALPDRRQNVRVLGEHQDGSLEAFVYFLDEIGFERKVFTIAPAGGLDPWLRNAFPVFQDQTLKYFDAVVVFRPE